MGEETWGQLTVLACFDRFLKKNFIGVLRACRKVYLINLELEKFLQVERTSVMSIQIKKHYEHPRNSPHASFQLQSKETTTLIILRLSFIE